MRIPVDLGERSYEIVVQRGGLGDDDAWPPLPSTSRRALVVTQEPVARPHLAPVEGLLRARGLEVLVERVPDGEAAKDVDVLAGLWRACADAPLGRGDVIVALGGGVVGDLAGFAAATWNRGVALIQVPTTLLAQVDSAIGGKTGINLPQGKNLVGAFHQPRAVVVDVDTLATLPDRERISGLGEIVKYGFIRDPGILDVLESDPQAARTGDLDVLEPLVARSAAVKAAVVAGDEREAGERAHLNLGHTFGHAVEALTGYTEFLHGEAVAIGMVAALRLGEALGRTPPGSADRCRKLCEALGLPVTAPRLDRDLVWEVMARDKKAQDGIRFVLLDDLARPVVVPVGRDAVDAAIDLVETT